MVIRNVQQLHKKRQNTSSMEEKPSNSTGKNGYTTYGGKTFPSNLPLMIYIQAARTINTQQNNRHSGQITYK